MESWRGLTIDQQAERLREQDTLEHGMLEGGIIRYWREYNRAPDEGIPEQQLLDAAVLHLAPLYQSWIDKVCEGKRSPEWIYPLLTIGAAKMADLTLRTVLRCWLSPEFYQEGQVSTPPLAQKVSTMIANDALAIINYLSAKDDFKEDWTRQSKFIKNWTPQRCSAFAKKMGKVSHMTLKQKQDFGHHMLRIAEQSDVIHTRVAIVKNRKSWKNTKRLYVEIQADILRELNQRHSLLQTMAVLYRPMICPPVDHTVERSGGYINKWIRKEMVQRYNSNYDDPDLKMDQKFSEPGQVVIDGLNVLMKTEWTVNSKVLEVMENLFKNNNRIGNLPTYDFEEYVHSSDYPKDGTKEEQAIWCQAREELWGMWYKQEQSRGRMLVRLALAKQMREYRFFYMPYTLDFRGRAYTTCELLSCQGSDFDKGLVMFANPVEQTTDGLYWLKVHLANLFDQDKLSFDDRVQWVDDNWDMILNIAQDPYDNLQWIDDSVKKNKSFQRLAAIYDITRKDGLTQVAVQMDGACNGSQHWSAIMGDEVTAELTNVKPSKVPKDLYQYIADRVTDVCEGDEDNEWYQIFLDHWDHSIDRKVTKRPTMCDAYGLTFYGIQKYIKIEGHVDWLPVDKKGAGIVELARAIQIGLDTTLVEPNKGKEYLKEICNIVSNVNQSVVYTTPSGFKVVHHYNKIKKRRSLASLFNHKELTFTSFTDDVNRKAAEQGIPPNFIHSLDASHMFCTIYRMILLGITSYSMIHDSYGCPAPQVSAMRQLIKEEFYEMHRSNLLEEFRRDIEEQLGVELPAVPMRGALDLSCVLESDYFFA
tara:strand:- start:2340 stop:4781 length:2442 start_codon:yes stop_codon:yes gene_type:complete